MKLSQVISIITLLVLLAPYFSFAQIPPPESFQPPEIPTRFFSCLPTDTLRQCLFKILGDGLRLGLTMVMAFAAVYILWAGLRYIIEQDASKRGEIKNDIIYAALGLVIAFLAWVMVAVLTKAIGGAGV